MIENKTKMKERWKMASDTRRNAPSLSCPFLLFSSLFLFVPFSFLSLSCPALSFPFPLLPFPFFSPFLSFFLSFPTPTYARLEARSTSCSRSCALACVAARLYSTACACEDGSIPVQLYHSERQIQANNQRC